MVTPIIKLVIHTHRLYRLRLSKNWPHSPFSFYSTHCSTKSLQSVKSKVP